ncbi:MAG: hypothetical protein JWO05_2153 [Gemmatimonadetes bacterium]|nr:hypothetical protein [Gemmatimonadota bacterium]
MSQLVEYLYPVPDFRRTPGTLLRWWERRRLMYNLVVGGVGIVTLVAFELASLAFGHGLDADVLMPVVAYGVIANLCYTWGWLLEVGAQKLWGRDCPWIGPALWRQGLAFSVGLTLLPLLAVSVAAVASVSISIFHWLTR